MQMMAFKSILLSRSISEIHFSIIRTIIQMTNRSELGTEWIEKEISNLVRQIGTERREERTGERKKEKEGLTKGERKR